MKTFELIIKEISSFADDENDVIFERDGSVAFERQGQMMEFKLSQNEDDAIWVEYNNNRLPYKKFLAKELARLDILANKILQRKSKEKEYVDPIATLITTNKKSEGSFGNSNKRMHR